MPTYTHSVLCLVLFVTTVLCATSVDGKTCGQVDPSRCLFRSTTEQQGTPAYLPCDSARRADLAGRAGPLFPVWITGQARVGKDKVAKHLTAELSNTNAEDWATYFVESNLADPCTVGVDYAFFTNDKGTFTIHSVEGTSAGNTSEHGRLKYAVMAGPGLVVHVTTGVPTHIDLKALADLVTYGQETSSGDQPAPEHNALVVANRFDHQWSVGGKPVSSDAWLQHFLSDHPYDDDAVRHAKATIRSGFAKIGIASLPEHHGSHTPDSWQLHLKALAGTVLSLTVDAGASPKQWVDDQLPRMLRVMTELAKDDNLDEALSSECATILPRIRTGLLRAYDTLKAVPASWGNGTVESSVLESHLTAWISVQVSEQTDKYGSKSPACAQAAIAEFKSTLEAVKSAILTENNAMRSIISTGTESRNRDCGRVRAYRDRRCVQRFVGVCVRKRHYCADDQVICADTRTIQTRANGEKIVSEWTQVSSFRNRIPGEYSC